ncbi:Cypemycin methyltransferase [Symmachiella dynata]|uniref:methyltransferase domain-containing protein n=1 Tax=Symmachiella dynata TaxID=2527995 RepID=UPI00118C6E14|nr:methyltransferase domain-containing protein [Symmachiella dynata]QDT48062.1 Cypemycin methyltransferase [Symmachiella dynata]
MTQQQKWDPQRYARNAGFVATLGMPVVELLAPQPGERILDLGCGDGVLTQKLAEMGCDVVGVDASPDQIEAARERDLDAHVVDCHNLEFDKEFDAVFSNAALHWMKRPAEVIAGVRRALKPQGRFVGEFGGAGNIHQVQVALSAALTRREIDMETLWPWYFPTPEEYQAELQAAGFGVQSIELIPRPTPLPGALTDWLETFAESFLPPIPTEEHANFFQEIQDAAQASLCDEQGQWTVDYVRLRFAAIQESA